MTLTSIRFTVCLPYTLAQECPKPTDWSNPANFSNDAHDPGGKTMCGIIQREYDQYRKANGLPTQDVRRISLDEGRDIYFNTYWLPHCPDLAPGIDLLLFDANVNMGSTEGTKVMQAALGVANDGDWGPHTQRTVANIPNVPAFIKTFTVRRQTVYRMMPGFRYFGDDWIRRASEIGAQALGMAGAA